jgi:Domain of unknown function (DUF4157)
MGADYRPVNLPPAVLKAVDESRAMVRLGYPWWLRPWMSRSVIAITLGRRIYLSSAAAARSLDYLDRLVRHELAHVRQVNRHGLIGFLIRYVAEFLRHLWRTRSLDAAYRDISFEVEARAAEESL